MAKQQVLALSFKVRVLVSQKSISPGITIMNQPPSIEKERLTRAGIIGVGLGILGVMLFGGFWVGLGALKVEVLPRLVMAVCLPPAILAGIMSAYMLISRR